MDVVPDVNSSMASALDMLISLSRSDDGNRDDDCGAGAGGVGNDSSGDPMSRSISVVR